MISKLFLVACLFTSPCAVLARKNKSKPTSEGRVSLVIKAGVVVVAAWLGYKIFSSKKSKINPDPLFAPLVERNNPILLCNGYIREFENDKKKPRIPEDIKRIIFKFYYERLISLRPKVIGKGDIGPPGVFVYSNEKNKLVYAGDSHREVWDTKECKVKKFSEEKTTGIMYNNVEKMILYMRKNQSTLFDAETLEKVKIPDNEKAIEGRFKAYFREKKMLFYSDDLSTTVFNSEESNVMGTLEGDFESLVCDNKKNRFFAARNRKITIFNLTNFEPIKVLETENIIMELAYSNEENKLFAIGDYNDSSNDRIIEVLDLDTFEREPCTLKDNVHMSFHKLVWDKKGNVFFVIGKNTVTAWDARNIPFKEIRTFKEEEREKDWIATVHYDSKSDTLYIITYGGWITKWGYS